MNDIKKFAKSSGIYFFGNILMKIITFLMLPLYTKYINPTDYGTYDLYIAYITFLCSVLFLDIWVSIMRYMFADKNNKSSILISGSSIFVLSSILYTIVVFVIGNIMNIPYLIWLYLYGILMNVQNLFGYIARGLEKNTLYAISGIIGTIITVISNIVLIVLFHMDYSALYISSCIGFIFSILIIYFNAKLYNVLKIKDFDKKIFIDIFKYSLPLCLNSVAYWFLTYYNKIAISNRLTAHDNGLYAIAGKFSAILTLVTSCFQMAWQELSFSKANMKKQEMGKFYSNAIDLYFKFLLVGMMICLPLVYLIFPYMTDSTYSEAKNLIPIYLLATIFSIISTFLGSIFGTIKETKKIFSTTLYGSIVDILAINLLIPFIGINSASIAIFLGFFVNVLLRIGLLKKYISIKINIKQIIKNFTFVIISMCAYYTNSVIINIVVFVIMCLIALYLMKDEIKLISNRIKKQH